MLDFHLNRPRRPHLSVCRRHEDEQIVQNGLALTPAQMQDLTNRGIPISPQNLGITYDEGFSNENFTPPLEYRRGVDLGDLWEAREEVNKRFKSSYDKGVKDGIVTPEGVE